jgi:hypothetical protein
MEILNGAKSAPKTLIKLEKSFGSNIGAANKPNDGKPFTVKNG